MGFGRIWASVICLSVNMRRSSRQQGVWQNMLLRYLLALLVAATAIALAALLASVVEARGMASYCFLMLSPAFFFQSVTHTASHGDTHRNIT